jgi:tetratricopeptide (TPR) repeat protein
MRALMRGEFDASTALGDEAAAIGQRANSVNATMLFAVHRFTLLSQMGKPREAHDAGRAITELMPGYGNPYFALNEAWLFGASGDLEQARASFRRLPDPDGGWIPLDSEWLPSMCQLAFAVTSLGERDAAGRAYERLLPFRTRFGIEGIGAGTHGSVERHLGLFARTAGRIDDAVSHLEIALDANRRAGARCLEARTMIELADTLTLRGAEDDVRRARELGSEAAVILTDLGLVEHGKAAVPPSPVANTFRAEGELWRLAFDGEVVLVKDVKGLHDIAALLARPGAEIAALDLVTPRGRSVPQAATEELGAPGHAGALLDDEARARYKARLDELEEDVADAEGLGDPVRAERARDERDAIVRELSAAYGLGGRPRRAGDPSERARTTVTRRIREAIGRIEDVHPALGRHLRNSVRTGHFCSYVPELRVDWDL